MGDKKVLTKEIAEKFLADEESVDLSEFTAIEDEAAKSLSKHKGDLWLEGIEELSDEAAKGLAALKEQELHIEGVTRLSDKAAKTLTTLDGWLCVNLFIVPPSAARIFVHNHDTCGSDSDDPDKFPAWLMDEVN
jgi:hypothetical protein